MAGNTPELPDLSLESAEYQTPEELATALEERSKQALADKIRAIAGQVQENSSDQLGRLRDELSPEEQTEIRDALPGTGIGRLLSKGMKKAEVAQDQMVASLGKMIPGGEEAVGKLSKLETWWHSIEDSWNTAEKLFSEGKFMAAFGVIMSGFMGKFSLTDWDKSQKDEPETPSVASGDAKVDTPAGIIKSSYHLAIETFLKVSKDTDRQAYNILNSPQIKTKTFHDLGLDESNVQVQGIAQRLGFPQASNVGEYDQKVADSLKLIKDKEIFIDSIMKRKHPDWRMKMPLDQILVEVYREAKFYTSFEGKTLSDFDIGSFESGFLNFGEGQSGDLNERLENLQHDASSPMHGLSVGFLSQLYGDRSSNVSPDYELSLNNAFSGNTLKPEEKAFLGKLTEFGKGIIGVISNNFFLGDPSKQPEFQQYFEKGLTTKTILELYIITGGNLDSNQYNDVQKGMIHLKVFSLLKDNRALRGDTYDVQILDYIKSGFVNGADAIPESLKEVLMNLMKNTLDSTMSYVKDIFIEVYHALSFKELMMVFIASGMLAFLLLKLTQVTKLAKAGLWGIGIGLVMQLISSFAVKEKFGNPKDSARSFAESIKSANPQKYQTLVSKYGSEKAFLEHLEDGMNDPVQTGLVDKL